MSNIATITYLTPKGRKMARDLIGHSYADILAEARKVARRPGVKMVKLWSNNGRLLTSLRSSITQPPE